MPAWEYLVQLWPLPGPEGDLLDLGRDGWELVTVIEAHTQGYFYFKRPKQ